MELRTSATSCTLLSIQVPRRHFSMGPMVLRKSSRLNSQIWISTVTDIVVCVDSQVGRLTHERQTTSGFVFPGIASPPWAGGMDAMLTQSHCTSDATPCAVVSKWTRCLRCVPGQANLSYPAVAQRTQFLRSAPLTAITHSVAGERVRFLGRRPYRFTALPKIGNGSELVPIKENTHDQRHGMSSVPRVFFEDISSVSRHHLFLARRRRIPRSANENTCTSTNADDPFGYFLICEGASRVRLVFHPTAKDSFVDPHTSIKSTQIGRNPYRMSETLFRQ